MEQKAFFQLKSSNDATGEITGIAAAFGNEDLDGDVIDPGAFKNSLATNPKVPILWQHDQASPIGVSKSLIETPEGLLMTAQLAIDTNEGKRAYDLLKMKAISGLSIGYIVGKKQMSGGVRHLQEIKLLEISVVTFQSNPRAVVNEVKAARTDIDANALHTAGAAVRAAQDAHAANGRAIAAATAVLDPLKYGREIDRLNDAHQANATALQLLGVSLAPILYRQDVNYPNPMGTGADDVDATSGPGGKSALYALEVMAARLKRDIQILDDSAPASDGGISDAIAGGFREQQRRLSEHRPLFDY